MLTREEKNRSIQEQIIKEENLKKIKKISKVFGIIFTTLALIIFYGLFIGAKVTIVHEYKITNNKISNNFNGLKIVHISDILYKSINSNDLTRIKKQINELNADIIIFTGNIKRNKNQELSKNEIDTLKDFFNKLNAKLEKYAVLGKNDDDSFNVIMDSFKILNNKTDYLYNKDLVPLEFIGFNTNDLNTDSIKKDSTNYKICILSNPDKIDEIDEINCNLALAGETLGGEIKLFKQSIFDNHKYNKEYYKLGEMDFYISNGLGNTLNVRYFNQPSINFYRLTNS